MMPVNNAQPATTLSNAATNTPHHQYEPYSYAAEHALARKEPSLEELEAAIKETPPRPVSSHHSRAPSSPRAWGEVMDESEKMLPHGSPGLRHTKGRLERSASTKTHDESYAEIVKHETPAGAQPIAASRSDAQDNHNSMSATKDGQTDSNAPNGDHVVKDCKPNGIQDKVSDEGQVNGDVQHESYAEVVQHRPTTPVVLPAEQQAKLGDTKADMTKADVDAGGDATGKRTPDATENDTPQHPPPRSPNRPSASKNAMTTDAALKQALNESSTLPQAISQPSKQEEADAQPGTLVYENYNSRSGSNLASIKPDSGYSQSLTQRKNKDISSEPPDKKNAANEKQASKRKASLVSGRRAGAGWSQSAIRWAPLNVPLQRRLQTLAVFLHSMSIPGLIALFFVLCAIPIFWPIIIPYLVYVLLSTAATDGKLSLRSEWVRRSKLWSLFAGYFPARLHRTVELEPTRKYVFGYHPHGIISHGAFAAFATEALGFSQLFPGITNTLLTLESNFRTPIYRDWALRVGLASVSRESCENLLTRGGSNGEGMGRAITIVVGGARESLDSKPGHLNLVLAKRKGFVKLAVRTGADLVPVLGFGENDMYEQVDSEVHPWIHKGQLAIKKFMGFTVPLFHARGIFNYDVGIMPYRRPVNVVVGRPIAVVQNKKPDPEYVNELHKEYTDELLHMWEEWKDTFAANRKAELEIVE